MGKYAYHAMYADLWLKETMKSSAQVEQQGDPLVMTNISIAHSLLALIEVILAGGEHPERLVPRRPGVAERDEITVAAYDSKPGDKEVADFLCDGIDDHIEIQAAFDLAARTGKPFRPLLGTYNLRRADQ